MNTLSTPSAIFYVSQNPKLDQFLDGSFNCAGSVTFGDFNLLQINSSQSRGLHDNRIFLWAEELN